MMANGREFCRHCRLRSVYSRRLCWRCFQDLRVRVLYPATAHADRPRRRERADWVEPTEAELDALIAEQSKPENLPAWWWEDVERQRQRDGGEL